MRNKLPKNSDDNDDNMLQKRGFDLMKLQKMGDKNVNLKKLHTSNIGGILKN